MKRLRDAYHCAIFCTAHTSKPTMAATSLQYRTRGASALAGTVDGTLVLEREQMGGGVLLHAPKMRGAFENPLPRRFRVDNGPDWCQLIADEWEPAKGEIVDPGASTGPLGADQEDRRGRP